MNLDQAIANLATLYRQSRLTPELHEIMRDSLNSLMTTAFPDKKLTSTVAPDVALNNFLSIYSRANLTAEEYDALKESFAALNKLINDNLKGNLDKGKANSK
jgi:hypothetical protein